MNQSSICRLTLLAASAILTACTTTSPMQIDPVPTSPPTINPASLTPAAMLTAYHWDLTRTATASDQAEKAIQQDSGKSPIRLTFNEEQRLSVQNLCNMIGASYALSNSNIQLGGVMGSKRACLNSGLMALENWVGVQLPKAESWQIQTTTNQPPVLTLRFNDGSQWLLSGFPTDETRYGSKPERVFLEVAPELVTCNTPNMPNAQCLQVRDVYYNEQGVQTNTGKWQVFHGDIDGFAFEPGIRTVLRLNRYTRANPPADVSRYVYVLDMRVISERVR